MTLCFLFYCFPYIFLLPIYIPSPIYTFVIHPTACIMMIAYFLWGRLGFCPSPCSPSISSSLDISNICTVTTAVYTKYMHTVIHEHVTASFLVADLIPKIIFLPEIFKFGKSIKRGHTSLVTRVILLEVC